MPGDLNVVILTGQIITDPVHSRINSNRTLSTTFSLQSNEHFINSQTGKASYYPNVVLIQSLGKNAPIVANKFVKGMKVLVSGYLRVEDSSFTVRALAISKEETFHSERYYEGIEHALDIAKNNRTKEAIVESLTMILQGKYNEE